MKPADVYWLPMPKPRECDECGAKLWPADWQSATGCVYCDHEDVLL